MLPHGFRVEFGIQTTVIAAWHGVDSMLSVGERIIAAAGCGFPHTAAELAGLLPTSIHTQFLVGQLCKQFLEA